MTDGGASASSTAPRPAGSLSPASGPIGAPLPSPAAAFARPERRPQFPYVCLVFTLLSLLGLAIAYQSYWSIMDTRVPRKADGSFYPQNVFDLADQEGRYSAVMNSGGLSLESVAGDSQLWRLLTVNFCATETAFSAANMSPFVMLIFTIVFIWLNFQTYELLLGSVRFAGFLVATGLGAGALALFRHAGLPYAGAYPFFLAVTLGFFLGHYRWQRYNKQLNEPYLFFMDLFVAGIQLVLCMFMMSAFSFIWV